MISAAINDSTVAMEMAGAESDASELRIKDIC